MFGGEQGATAETSRLVDTVYEHDPASLGWRQRAAMPTADRWTRLPDLPTQRNHLAAAAVDGRLFVIGGRFGRGVAAR